MIKDTLLKLLAVHGATGHEEKIAAVIADMLRPYADSVETDVLGNLIVRKHGAGKRVMFAAHMDHIGFIATDADEHGFVRLYNVGGIDVSVSVGQRVVFENGVEGVIGAEEDIEGAPKMQNLYADIGASTREEALARVAIGDVAVYAPAVSQLGEWRLASPAMDDRAGCAVLVEAFMQMAQANNEIVAVFTVQEEVGLRGARTAAYAVDPDFAIALDVTLTGDVPEAKPKMAVKLGAGAAIKVMDRSVICTPAVCAALEQSGADCGVATQREILQFGGTDTAALQKARAGVQAGAISIPTRYIHSPSEMCAVSDVEGAAKLLARFAAM